MKTIGVAVIGAGHWGPNLVRCFEEHLSSDIRWVVDLDEERLRQVGLRFPGVGLSRDAEQAFGDAAVDAVVVATPSSTHYDYARRALLAGKHVLVEKPITTKLEHAEDLDRMARSRGLTLMVGHVFVHNLAIQRVKRYLAEGLLGRLYYLSMVRTNLGPIRTDVNAAWDLAAHDISIANYWLDALPEAVSGVGGRWINKAEDAVFAVLRYPNGTLAQLHASWLNPRKIRDITVVGEHKMLTFNDLDLSEPIRIYDKGVSEERTTRGYMDTFASFRAGVRNGDVLIPNVGGSSPLRSECEHFIACIQEKREPLSGGREGCAVVRVLQALDRSLANGGREEKV